MLYAVEALPGPTIRQLVTVNPVAAACAPVGPALPPYISAIASPTR